MLREAAKSTSIWDIRAYIFGKEPLLGT